MEGKIFTTSIEQKKQAQGGVMKGLGERTFWGRSFSWVVFLGKGRRRMMHIGKWWKRESGLDVCSTLKEYK